MPKRERTIVYEVHDGLYINRTNRCPCACTFMDKVGIPAAFGESMSLRWRK